MLASLRFILDHPLNRGSKTAAFRRWFSWQVRSRLAKRPMIEPFVNRTVLVAENGMTGATGNIYCGLHEVADMGFVLHSLRPGDLFLDVGANIGSYSLLAGGGVGCTCVSIEPVPETYEKLRRNIGANDLFGSIETHNVGAGSSPGSLRFSTGLDTVNHVVSEGEDVASVDVNVVILDDVLGDRCPRVIKIDVEGFELEVLRGLERSLRSESLEAIVMEVNGSGERYGVSDQEICDFLTVRGFTMHSYDALKRKLTNPDGSGNVIFVRDASKVEQRVATAPRFQLVTGTI